ncbi:endonuclease [Neptunitalea lumnitzerae]|nr:endonuclease [Neptunitalea sp. Y10]
MNKKLLFLSTLLLATVTGYAQIPTGYYDTATGLTGYTLKTQLKKIIDDVNDSDITTEYLHNDQGYNAMDSFISMYDLDTYYENDNSILDPYSENPNGTDPYNYTPTSDECGNYNSEGDCYNKEHVIPQSVFSQASPMRGDAHHLLPTDGRVNGFRSNYPFGIVNDNNLVSQSGISNPTQNGSKLGGNLNSGVSAGYTGTVFEPIDEFKGDIARIYFYFITRYEDQVSNWSSYDMFNGSSDQVLDEPFLSILLAWNAQDPVSQKEIDRNNNIYNYQGNRNPFIDHPEYINEIWGGGSTTDTTPPSTPVISAVNQQAGPTLQVTWGAATDNVGVTAYEVYMDGTYVGTTSNTYYTTALVSYETVYCFNVYAVDAAGNTSNASTQVCFMTTADNGTTASELLFTEYIEGSGSNKALEIGNFTGTAVSLDDYSIQLSANGNAGWTASYNFPSGASIAHGDVYVIGNGGLTVCTSETDDLNNAITGFNGNDAIGLFKNGALIDIIGELGNSSNFAQNTTLVRNESISYPNTTYTPSEWNTFASNTCFLGSHTMVFLGTDAVALDKASISLYPNPVHGTVVNFDIPQNITVTQIDFYSVLGKNVLSVQSIRNHQVSIANLSKGIYLVQLQTSAGAVTKKLVIK